MCECECEGWVETWRQVNSGINLDPLFSYFSGLLYALVRVFEHGLRVPERGRGDLSRDDGDGGDGGD